MREYKRSSFATRWLVCSPRKGCEEERRKRRARCSVRSQDHPVVSQAGFVRLHTDVEDPPGTVKDRRTLGLLCKLMKSWSPGPSGRWRVASAGCIKDCRSPEPKNALHRSNCAIPNPACIESRRSPQLKNAVRHQLCCSNSNAPALLLYCSACGQRSFMQRLGWLVLTPG